MISLMAAGDGRISAMDNNLYALETLVAIKLAEARAESRRLDLLALVRAGHPCAGGSAPH